MAYKHDYDKALFRLTQIIAKLYQGAKLSNKELAEEFGVSTKTIQRDFSKLVALFPIYQEKKLWQLESNFEFEEHLSIEDDITLKLLLQTSKSFDKSFQDRASQLLSRINDNIKSPIYTKIALEDISPKLPEVNFIEEAINSSRQISFTYSKGTDNFKVTANPYKIVNFDSFWYLVAKKENQLRKYYLQYISAVTLEETIFRKSKKVEELIHNAINIWFNDESNIDVELLVDKSIIEYFQRKSISPTQEIKGYDEDGNMIVSLKVTHKNEIIPIIKYWLPYIKVLSPKEINKEIKQELLKFIKWT